MRFLSLRNAARAFLALCCLQLGACGSVAIEAGTVAVDKATVWNRLVAAREGDPAAQYAVGEALCCSGDVAEGTIYSTAEAMEWLCIAAEQGNADAMMKLGDIFDGDQVDGVRLLRRAITALSETPMNRAAAHYWYLRAVDTGQAEAVDAAEDLQRRMTPSEKVAAKRYAVGSAPPCSWADLRASAVTGGTGAPAPEGPR